MKNHDLEFLHTWNNTSYWGDLYSNDVIGYKSRVNLQQAMKYMRLMNYVSKDKGQRQPIWLQLLLQAIKTSQVECSTRRKITDTRNRQRKGKKVLQSRARWMFLGFYLESLLWFTSLLQYQWTRRRTKVWKIMSSTHCMHISLHCTQSATVPNVSEENGENGEINENFVAEVRAYLEEQKRKSATERNKRQISGSKYTISFIICIETIHKGTSEIRMLWCSSVAIINQTYVSVIPRRYSIEPCPPKNNELHTCLFLQVSTVEIQLDYRHLYGTTGWVVLYPRAPEIPAHECTWLVMTGPPVGAKSLKSTEPVALDKWVLET